MPATDGIDPRIQEFLDSFEEQTRTLVRSGDLGSREAGQLLNEYQTVARERHDEIVALIPQMGIDDAIFEAGQRHEADKVDPRLATLLTQFPNMRDEILSGKEEIIRHVDRGVTVQDALYETEIARVGHDRTPGFREDVEAVFSAGHYGTRVEAAAALDHARSAAGLRSWENTTQAAHDNSLPRYVQDRQQDGRSDTPWQAPTPNRPQDRQLDLRSGTPRQAPNQPPAYTPPEQPPAYQPGNANVARHAGNPGQRDQQPGNQSERDRSHGTTGAGTPRYNLRNSRRGGRGSSGR